jgi:hypothetical protein
LNPTPILNDNKVLECLIKQMRHQEYRVSPQNRSYHSTRVYIFDTAKNTTPQSTFAVDVSIDVIIEHTKKEKIIFSQYLKTI